MAGVWEVSATFVRGYTAGPGAQVKRAVGAGSAGRAISLAGRSCPAETFVPALPVLPVRAEREAAAEGEADLIRQSGPDWAQQRLA